MVAFCLAQPVCLSGGAQTPLGCLAALAANGRYRRRAARPRYGRFWRLWLALDAVWIAADISPLQVLGRLPEWRFAGQVRAVTVGSFAMLGLLLAMLLLSTMPAWWLTGLLFAALYGMVNGVMTIERSAAPVELFGPANVGTLLGRLARPNFIAKALAPALFAALLSAGMSLQVALYLLIGLALLAWGRIGR